MLLKIIGVACVMGAISLVACGSEFDGLCGDGYIVHHAQNGGGEPYEEKCDDGNTVDGDGCSSSCEIEPGFTCTNAGGRPSECSEL